MPKHSECQCVTASFSIDIWMYMHIQSNRLLQHFEMGSNTKWYTAHRPRRKRIQFIIHWGCGTLQCILRCCCRNVVLHVIIFPSASESVRCVPACFHFFSLPISEWVRVLSRKKKQHKIICNKLSMFKANDGCECFAVAEAVTYSYSIINFIWHHIWIPSISCETSRVSFMFKKYDWYICIFLSSLCIVRNTGENLINFHSSFYIFRMLTWFLIHLLNFLYHSHSHRIFLWTYGNYAIQRIIM